VVEEGLGLQETQDQQVDLRAVINKSREGKAEGQRSVWLSKH